ncbi:MAG: hypothetical protein U0Z17_09345 [Bacteroidales bacterium]
MKYTAPFLVRSSQQEGMSFLNSDLVSSVLFSAGGFEARYGDKLSSVLDIKYKRPTALLLLPASLLGASAHVEGTGINKKFTYLAGARYKTTNTCSIRPKPKEIICLFSLMCSHFSLMS